jgi:hypothetical protein
MAETLTPFMKAIYHMPRGTEKEFGSRKQTTRYEKEFGYTDHEV